MFLRLDQRFFIIFSTENLRIISIKETEHFLREADICVRKLLEEESLEVDDPSSL